LSYRIPSEGDGRLHILEREPWISRKELIEVHVFGKLIRNQLNRDPRAANDWLANQHGRILGDSFSMFFLRHDVSPC
jgi:hypothetical protein